MIGFVNASVSSQLLQITYKTSVIKDDVIIIDERTGGLYVNGTIDADIPVSIPKYFIFYVSFVSLKL